MLSGLLNYLHTHRKAVVGAILAGAAAGFGTMINGSTWQVIVVAVVAGALGVGAIPNREAKPKPT